ncbi:transcription termination factor NusA [Patescibacteria group bacterium]|nr:transcription termination factor NusA [Patescibacteria group bacterium]
MSQFNEEEFFAAIEMISEEKKLPKEKVWEVIEAALAVAYRKDYGRPQMEIKAQMGQGGLDDVKFFIVKEVIADDEEVKDELTQMNLKEAKKKDPDIKVEEKVWLPAEAPENFGRIAAQTAKQVIIQRLREAERETVFNEFKDKEGQIISGSVQRIEGQNVFVDLGPAIGILQQSGRVPGEHYRIGQRLKLLLEKVEQSPKGAQIVLSRSNAEFIKKLFTIEIPEIDLETVEIKSIARDPGVRSKVAVFTNQEGVDPIGSCVGQKGTRVQAIINEIGDEKIDIILWDDNPVLFIKNALSPAKIAKVVTDESNKNATIYVEADQQSLAIGRNGQNVKLASKLTDWKLDIVEASKEVLEKLDEQPVQDKPAVPKPTDRPAPKVTDQTPANSIDQLSIGRKTITKLKEAKFDSIDKLATAKLDDLTKVEGIGPATAGKIHKLAKEYTKQ